MNYYLHRILKVCDSISRKLNTFLLVFNYQQIESRNIKNIYLQDDSKLFSWNDFTNNRHEFNKISINYINIK